MGARRVYSIATPFLATELTDLRYEQSADVLKITHVAHPPQKLSRYGHIDWRMADEFFGATNARPTGVGAGVTQPVTSGAYPEDHVYAVSAIDAASGAESLLSEPSGTVSNDLDLKGNYNTVSWTAVDGASGYRVYKQVNGVYGFLGAATGTSYRDDNILPDLATGPTLENRQPFSASLNDRPGCVTFHQQRTVYARTLSRPNAIYATRASDLSSLNVSEPLRDDDAWSLALVARQVNAVEHLVPLRDLVVLTTDAIFTVTGRGESRAITATDFEIKPESYRGASKVRPAVVDDVIFYCDARGGAVRTLGYQFEADGYRGSNITVFAPDFFSGVAVTALAWAPYPLSVLWAPTTRGELLALTWQAEQDVWGWTLCSTDGFVEDAATISENGEDATYLVVRRSGRRYVERTARVNVASEIDAVHLDSARTYRGDPATVLRGMDHLEGRTVSALADGAPVEELVVRDGAVRLPVPASVVHVGLPYTPWIRTLPLAQAQEGRKAAAQQISTAVISVVATRGIEAAQGKDRADPGEPPTPENEAKTFHELKTRSGERYGQTPYPFTGDLLARLEGTDWRTASVVVRQRYPLRMTVTGVAADIAVGGT